MCDNNIREYKKNDGKNKPNINYSIKEIQLKNNRRISTPRCRGASEYSINVDNPNDVEEISNKIEKEISVLKNLFKLIDEKKINLKRSKNILELNKYFITKHRTYKKYYDHNYNGIKIGEVDSYLFELLTSDSANDTVLTNYGLKKQSTDEFLRIMYDLDYGKLYTTSLCLTQDDLIQPIDINEVLNRATEMSIEDFPSTEKETKIDYIFRC